MVGDKNEHDNLGSLIADLRNKLGPMVSYVALHDILEDSTLSEDQTDSVNKLIKREHKKLLEATPLIKKYMDEFDNFNLDK